MEHGHPHALVFTDFSYAVIKERDLYPFGSNLFSPCSIWHANRDSSLYYRKWHT